MLKYRKIEDGDNERLAQIIRSNLERFHLDKPGTVYFDPELNRLSAFYNAEPAENAKRAYYVALDECGAVSGGVGIAEFDGIDSCAELQKLYLDDSQKGRGYGKELVLLAEKTARALGYKLLYLETHTNLKTAVGLYEKLGFRQIEKPRAVVHDTMNLFYLKEL